ncbi:MAG: hypothetical protein HRT47_12915 [Candidatus Caenarcaniphilales bacterium]|nr:hypothetical protein [Candidatus Caenarcaniphilales bacterium]
MDQHPSKISNISSATPLFTNREIKRNDYIVPNEILKNKQKFVNLVHSYNNKLADYSSRLMVSSSTLSITLRNIFKYHPNYRFTYDELFNMLLKALDTQNLANPKANIENERAIRKPIATDDKALAGKVELVDRFSSAKKTPVTNTGFDESALKDDLKAVSYLGNNPQYLKQIQSNKDFASWLLNNPAALGSMLSKPKFTSFFISAFNPRMLEKMSPVFFSQIASLIGQLLKLRQGKASGTSMGIEEEDHLEDARKSSEVENDNHHHNIVDEVKNVINTIPIKSVKDFLLEAERFVEEEIAMFYSIQKHLEKEILKQINKNKK